MIDDTIKEPYIFTITPLSIEHTDKAKMKLKKKILIKLGTRTIKFENFDIPLTIKAEVLFSKIMQKYYPLKGIIKVYDVTQEGNQIISSVGAFQTDDLLNEKRTSQTIEKELGSTVLRMKVQAKLQNQDSNLNVPSQIEQLKKKKSSQSFVNKLQEMDQMPSKKQSQPSLPSFSKISKIGEKVSQYDCKFDESSIPNQSFSNLSLTCPQLFEQYQKKQMQMLGQELIEQRRKSRYYEESIEKLTLKVQTLRKKNKQFEALIKGYEAESSKFLSSLDQDWKGQYLFELNEKKSTLIIKYKKEIDFQVVFGNFISFISQKILTKTKSKSSSREQSCEYSDVDSVLNRIQEIYSEKARYEAEKVKQLEHLNIVIEEQSMKINEQQFLIQSKANEVQSGEKKIQELQTKVKSAEQVNSYLRDKDQQMEYIIQTKDNSIQNLRKMLSNVSSQMDEIEQQNMNSKKAISNLGLTIEELKQQVSLKDEQIEIYKLKYGLIKKPQKRDIQNEINDCLRWINQQNKILVENSMDQTLQSQVFENKGDTSLNSILKNTDKLANLQIEEVVKFRTQLHSVVKVTQEIIAKNQQGILNNQITFSDIKK